MATRLSFGGRWVLLGSALGLVAVTSCGGDTKNDDAKGAPSAGTSTSGGMSGGEGGKPAEANAGSGGTAPRGLAGACSGGEAPTHCNDGPRPCAEYETEASCAAAGPARPTAAGRQVSAAQATAARPLAYRAKRRKTSSSRARKATAAPPTTSLATTRVPAAWKGPGQSVGTSPSPARTTACGPVWTESRSAASACSPRNTRATAATHRGRATAESASPKPTATSSARGTPEQVWQALAVLLRLDASGA